MKAGSLVLVIGGIAVVAGACGSVSRPLRVASRTDLTQALPGQPAQVLAAARSTLAQFGLQVSADQPEAGTILSQEVLIQTSWAGRSVSDYLLCGVPTTSRDDLGFDWLFSIDRKSVDVEEAAVELTNAIPVRVRMAVLVEPRMGGSSARLIVNAAGRRPALSALPGTRPLEMACLPTEALAATVFAMLGQSSDIMSQTGPSQ